MQPESMGGADGMGIPILLVSPGGGWVQGGALVRPSLLRYAKAPHLQRSF